MKALRMSFEGIIMASLVGGAMLFAFLILFKFVVTLLLVMVLGVALDRAYLRHKGRLDAGRNSVDDTKRQPCPRV